MNQFRKAQEGLKAGDTFVFEGETFKMVRDTSISCTYPVKIVRVGAYTATPDTTNTGRTNYSFSPDLPSCRGYKFVRNGEIVSRTQPHAIGMARGRVSEWVLLPSGKWELRIDNVEA